MRNEKGRQLLTALAVVGALATQLAPATPAHAVAGLQRISVSTASNSSSPKTVSATCPAGKVVIGGGGTVTGGSGHVGLTEVEPLTAQNAYQAQAAEESAGFVGNWSLNVVAICADAGALNGLEYKVASDPEEPIATCSPGKKVIGVGGAIAGGSPNVALEDVVPKSDLSAVAVRVYTEPVVVTWTARAWAICATAPAGLVLMTSVPMAGTASVACPAGKRVHGAGSEILANGSQHGHVRPSRISPYNLINVSLAGVSATASEDTHNPPDGWQVRAYAICAS